MRRQLAEHQEGRPICAFDDFVHLPACLSTESAYRIPLRLAFWQKSRHPHAQCGRQFFNDPKPRLCLSPLQFPDVVIGRFCQRRQAHQGKPSSISQRPKLLAKSHDDGGLVLGDGLGSLARHGILPRDIAHAVGTYYTLKWFAVTFDKMYNKVLRDRIFEDYGGTMPEETLGVDTIECPFCAEVIKRKAAKCKHCGSDLSAGFKSIGVSNDTIQKPDVQTVEQTSKDWKALGVLGVMLLVAGCVVLFSGYLNTSVWLLGFGAGVYLYARSCRKKAKGGTPDAPKTSKVKLALYCVVGLVVFLGVIGALADGNKPPQAAQAPVAPPPRAPVAPKAVEPTPQAPAPEKPPAPPPGFGEGDFKPQEAPASVAARVQPPARAAAPALPANGHEHDVKTITIDARRLYSDYQENEVAADEEYKGQQVLVLGTVETIGKEIMGGSYVTLETGEFGSVQCMFHNDSKAQLANLRKGQQVRIQGTVSGLLMNVHMKDCVLK